MKLYLAGPMRGIPYFNKPAFTEAAERLRAAGYEVFSPSEEDDQKWPGMADSNPTGDPLLASTYGCNMRVCMETDLGWICRNAEGIALLAGWEKSTGVGVEVALGKALGLMWAGYEAWLPGGHAHARAQYRDDPSKFVRPPELKIVDDRPVTAAVSRLPTSAAERKEYPMARGLIDYFPDALAYVSRISKVGNDQHNPGQDIHWARGKSTDHHDCIVRHLLERGSDDTDGLLHDGKLAWRALAALQEVLERRNNLPLPRGARAG